MMEHVAAPVLDFLYERCCCKRRFEGVDVNAALKRPRVHGDTRKKVHKLLQDKRLLEQVSEAFFEQVAHRRARGSIQHGDLEVILERLAKQICCNPKDLQSLDIHMLFDRFDTDCDGTLDRPETDRLVRSILDRLSDSAAVACDSDLLDLPIKRLADNYVVIKKLGQGGQGAMFLAKDNRIDSDVCVKFYEKGNLNAPLEDIKHEFALLKSLNSPYVARTFEMFQDRSYIYTVNEPYFGQDLTHLVVNAQDAGIEMTEQWLAGIFSQVLKGLVYLHLNRVIHRDLKEANVMVAGKQDWHRPHIVLIDFGLAQHFVSFDECHVAGTPGYIPPETWRSGYWVPKGDVFSAGVIFYQIRSGKQAPFLPNERQEAAMNEDSLWKAYEHLTSSVEVPLSADEFSPHLSCLVSMMLSKDFRPRPTASRCLQNVWFEKAAEVGAMSGAAVEKLRGLQKTSAVQRIAAERLLGTCNVGQMRDLNDLFRRLDADNDGRVTATEARQAVQKLPREVAESLIEALDSGGSIDYRSFMAQMMREQAHHFGSEIQDLFNEFDTDGDNFISLQEASKLVAACNFEAREEQIIAEVDTDGDGRISFEEFRHACLGDGLVAKRLRKSPKQPVAMREADRN